MTILSSTLSRQGQGNRIEFINSRNLFPTVLRHFALYLSEFAIIIAIFSLLYTFFHENNSSRSRAQRSLRCDAIARYSDGERDKARRGRALFLTKDISLIAAASGAHGSRDRTGNVHQSNDRIGRWTIAARIERHAKPRSPANFR